MGGTGEERSGRPASDESGRVVVVEEESAQHELLHRGNSRRNPRPNQRRLSDTPTAALSRPANSIIRAAKAIAGYPDTLRSWATQRSIHRTLRQVYSL